MTYFTLGIDKYLASWILPDTWHTDQDIEDRFYCFVMAINRNSKDIIVKQLGLDDPELAQYPIVLRKKFSKNEGRNPRTSDKNNLKEKLMLAVERNHPNFDKQYAADLINELADKAMIILDALYFAKKKGFPNENIRRWNPPLK